MTKGKIENLRDEAAAAAEGDGMAGVDRYCAVIQHKDLTRLLDEREALLLAAKYAVENEPNRRQQTRYAGALRNAIAKAEAP